VQRVVVPTSQKGIVEANGFPSRQMQILLSALAANSVPTTENATTGAPLGAVVLLQNVALVPPGWAQIDTITIGANIYKLITQV
jgi:hypothetical protein